MGGLADGTTTAAIRGRVRVPTFQRPSIMKCYKKKAKLTSDY
jgi:hypothetical protein